MSSCTWALEGQLLGTVNAGGGPESGNLGGEEVISDLLSLTPQERSARPPSGASLLGVPGAVCSVGSPLLLPSFRSTARQRRLPSTGDPTLAPRPLCHRSGLMRMAA